MKATSTPRPRNGKNSLAHIQRLMLTALRRPLTEDEEMQPQWDDGRATSEIAETFIKPNDRLNAFERLQIYGQQYWWRLIGCLRDDLTGLRAILGDAKFDALITAYLVAHPSRSWSMRDLAQRLPEFILQEPKLTKPRTIAAADMARFEWAQTLAFDEARKKSVEGDELLGSHAETLKLGLQPYLSLLELQYAVDEYSMGVKRQSQSLRSEASNAAEAPKQRAAKKVPPLKKKPIWLAVHRLEHRVYFKRLDREAFLMLQALRDGRTITEAIEAALEDADPARDWIGTIREWFEAWAALGWFCRRKD